MLSKRLDNREAGTRDMAEPRIFTSADELRAGVGEQLGYRDWLEVDQKRIDLFAEATGDHQWIHVDPEARRAAPSAPRSPTAILRCRCCRSSDRGPASRA